MGGHDWGMVYELALPTFNEHVHGKINYKWWIPCFIEGIQTKDWTILALTISSRNIDENWV
jgi:hypothetical protein